eukprot:CAMPEP_0172451786 /NCGR_PEP_ID=MMETSP1065-20121228/9677_1 /TAXON_ID=265537 /ORGANISM="Amphiprora paludosa, Strain CCMP125" /LENGTH=439 /DNA_ID=CAMNT_0013203757 /DNA_START=769 /DNA_END=2088 /DNA_ORIENTATION=+
MSFQPAAAGASDSDQPTRLPDGYSPARTDVCLGRGKQHWNHPGNVQYRKLIQDNVDAYQGATGKRVRTQIVSSILAAVRNDGGKFIKQDGKDKPWYEIGHAASLEKVDHSLRDQSTKPAPAVTLGGPEELPEDYEPSPLDVYRGRGKKHWNREGNMKFRELIRSKVHEYQSAADKEDKTEVIVSVVNTVREQGGRFLMQHDDTGRWYDIGESQARMKVYHSLRDQVYQLSKPSPSPSQDASRAEQKQESSPRKRSRSEHATAATDASRPLAISSSTAGSSAATSAQAIGGRTAVASAGIPPGVQVAPPYPSDFSSLPFAGIAATRAADPVLSQHHHHRQHSSNITNTIQRHRAASFPPTAAAPSFAFSSNPPPAPVTSTNPTSSAGEVMRDDLFLSAARGELPIPNDMPMAHDDMFSSSDNGRSSSEDDEIQQPQTRRL